MWSEFWNIVTWSSLARSDSKIGEHCMSHIPQFSDKLWIKEKLPFRKNLSSIKFSYLGIPWDEGSWPIRFRFRPPLPLNLRAIGLQYPASPGLAPSTQVPHLRKIIAINLKDRYKLVASTTINNTIVCWSCRLFVIRRKVINLWKGMYQCIFGLLTR